MTLQIFQDSHQCKIIKKNMQEYIQWAQVKNQCEMYRQSWWTIMTWIYCMCMKLIKKIIIFFKEENMFFKNILDISFYKQKSLSLWNCQMKYAKKTLQNIRRLEQWKDSDWDFHLISTYPWHSQYQCKSYPSSTAYLYLL